MVNLIKCSFCDILFNCAQIYFKHLKTHYTPIGTDFICNFEECYQNFSSKDSFKRHILNHFKKNQSSTNLNTNLGQEISNCLTSIQPNINMGVIQNESSSNSSFSYDNVLKSVQKSVSNFVIQLHSNNNFSRSDILFLQKSIEGFIIDPICDLVETTIGNNKIAITEILSDIRSLFKNVRTDYMLEKYLTENGLIKELRVFSIDNSQNAKGTLMPLRFQFEQIFKKTVLLTKFLLKWKLWRIVKKRLTSYNRIYGNKRNLFILIEYLFHIFCTMTTSS